MAHGRKVLEQSRRQREPVFRLPGQIRLPPLESERTACFNDAKNSYLLLLLDVGL